MPTRKSPRKGSLQFWPRKRVRKFLPSVNWDAIKTSPEKKLKGFICYKAGMISVHVRDNTSNSMTKGKNIILPVTVLECPSMKIFSVRFYKNGKVLKEILAENPDKELKRKLKIPRAKKKDFEDVKEEEYDDLRVIVYSQVKKTNIKKTPDIVEIGISGNKEEKIRFIKENMGKELSVLNFFSSGQLVDLRGLTKGKGLAGPVKRFGIHLKDHKSEKGQRRPGSLGPWHPARVTFRAPQAGQLGTFTRVKLNSKVIDMGSSKEREIKGIKNFGDIKTDYVIVHGSVQGPEKRQLIITQPLRETKKQAKKSYELLELR